MATPVTVYTTPNCNQCKATKRKLTALDIPFDTVDLSEDETAMAMVKELGYSKAPVVIAGDQHWDGYRDDLIKNLVAA